MSACGVRCTARRCCLGNGFTSCAECPKRSCALLARVQSVWDGVPEIAARLSPADSERWALPYCGHRERLAAARRSGPDRLNGAASRP